MKISARKFINSSESDIQNSDIQNATYKTTYKTANKLEI